jgi:hypothetical protein
MVQAARRMLEGTTGEAVLCDIEDLAEPAESFDWCCREWLCITSPTSDECFAHVAHVSPRVAAWSSRSCIR